LWWQRLCNDCGGGVGAVIAAVSLVGTIIAAAALIGAAMAVMVALVQRLRQHCWLVQWRWRRDCGDGGIGAVIAVMVAFVQELWQRQRQRSNCGGGFGAVIVASASFVQQLRRPIFLTNKNSYVVLLDTFSHKI
jgi:hypothetical protein